MVEWLPEHTESPKEGTQPVRGIYLLPNLLTTAALFAGFYAIIQSVAGHFDHAAIAIFVAGLLDGLDGRVARLVNAQSKFGKEYDGLSDVISFGVAPALMVYIWALQPLGGLGKAVAFAYLICIALRLARYNSKNIDEGHLHFSGLASPAGAVVLSSMVWFGSSISFLSNSILGQLIVCVFTTLIAMLTVLNIPYRSFKELDFRGRVPFFYIFTIAFIFVAIFINPPSMLLLFSGMYTLSGPLNLIYQKNRFLRLLVRAATGGLNARSNKTATATASKQKHTQKRPKTKNSAVTPSNKRKKLVANGIDNRTTH